jgi:hypothetical protein
VRGPQVFAAPSREFPEGIRSPHISPRKNACGGENCTAMVQFGKNLINCRRFQFPRSLFHMVFNRTVENFNRPFTTHAAFERNVARKLPSLTRSFAGNPVNRRRRDIISSCPNATPVENERINFECR